jgi:demethylmenaquinone methyltransferase/2-methoxy-6-polyprenyl-1,4-benzoquinol methylase
MASLYDAAVEPFNSALRRYVLKVAQPSPGMRVLEVGCGTGSNLTLFAEAGCEVAGIDLSPSMLDLASRKIGERADLELGDASAMPYEDRSFDLVLAFLTLHEMPVQIRDSVVAEMVRVARDDGRLLFVDFHHGPFEFPKGWLYRAVIVPIELAAGREHFRNHRDFLRRKGLPGLIDGNGLTVEKEKILGGGTMMISVARLMVGQGPSCGNTWIADRS